MICVGFNFFQLFFMDQNDLLAYFPLLIQRGRAIGPVLEMYREWHTYNAL